MSIWGTVPQENFLLGNCSFRELSFENSPQGKSLRGTANQGKLHQGNVCQETVLEPFSLFIEFILIFHSVLKTAFVRNVLRRSHLFCDLSILTDFVVYSNFPKQYSSSNPLFGNNYLWDKKNPPKCLSGRNILEI